MHGGSVRFVIFMIVGIGAVAVAGASDMVVNVRGQTKKEVDGRDVWETTVAPRTLRGKETAVIVCDMWDRHWCAGATERVAVMAPRMNEVLKAARARGVAIIHAPSETMKFYQDTPARKRMRAAPRVEMPKLTPRLEPPLPIDDSDGGCDSGEKPWYKAWTRQHPAIEIDQKRDGISDSGQEVWNFLHRAGGARRHRQKRIKTVLMMGVHTNMCVLGRPFAIRALVRRGVDVLLVRDLTDTMYNPAMPPHVSHDEGTSLVVDYIEKNYCPSMTSEDILKGAKRPR